MFSDHISVLPGHPPDVIDLSAAPYEPAGLRAVEHLTRAAEDRFVWLATAVALSRDADQLAHGGLSAGILRSRLRKKPCFRMFNANLLDFLVRHTADIPIEKADPGLEEPELAFFGTVYADKAGTQYVRTLRRSRGSWTESLLALDSACDRRYYAMLWNENWLDQLC